jgi:tRNA A-37 threonylcarbamoyl transferase component Bud32
VVGYGGWDDVLTQTLARVAADPGSFPDVIWTFHSNDPQRITTDHASLLSQLRPAIDRGRMALACGVDCHTFFQALDQGLSRLQRRESPHRRMKVNIGALPNWQRSEGAARQNTRQAASAEEALRGAYRLREEFIVTGYDASDLDREILRLRRSVRSGVVIKEGDSLLDGRFLLLQQLGHGGFASVWKTYDREVRQVVAAKILHPQHNEDRTRVERFLRGARKMRQMSHQGIVRVIDEALADGDYRFFTMDFINGGDLRAAIQQGRVGRDTIPTVIMDVAEALEFAHSKGVVHRDVKPSNILLNDYGKPLLTDFDLVHAIDTSGGTLSHGGMMGTFIYAAPETMREPHRVEEATADEFSLAMTTVFCYHGQDLPADALFEVEQFLNALECSESIRRVLRKALSRDPLKRFGSTKEFAEMLAGAVAEGS